MVLAQVPLVQSVREGGDTGKPVVLEGDPYFSKLTDRVIEAVNIRNEQLAPTKIVDVN